MAAANEICQAQSSIVVIRALERFLAARAEINSDTKVLDATRGLMQRCASDALLHFARVSAADAQEPTAKRGRTEDVDIVFIN